MRRSGKARSAAVVCAVGGALALTGCANDPPVADFTLNPNPTSGQTVTFDGSASHGGRDANDQPIAVDRWEWDLDGNGTFERTTWGPTVRHSFEGDKKVDVALRVVSRSGRVSPVASRTVVTSERQTAAAPASGACPVDSGDGNGCGTGPLGDPLDTQTTEDVPPPPLTTSLQPPSFRAFFGGSWADPGHPETAISITHGGDRVYALDYTNDVDMHDATSLAYLGEFDVADGARDLAYYRGEVYVLNKDGDVEVFSTAGVRSRVLRFLPLGGVAGAAEPVSFGRFAVAWNEIWTTIGFGDKAGAGIVVRDATTGALKSALVHMPGTACVATAYNADGSHWCVADKDRATWDAANAIRTSGAHHARAGISAVPEHNAVVTQCRGIGRTTASGVLAGHSHLFVGDPLIGGNCQDYGIDAQWLGSDAPWGMRRMLQVTKWWDSYDQRWEDRIDEFRLEDWTDLTLVNRATYVSRIPYREFLPQDNASNNDRDVSYRARETRVDWSGTLTKDPSDWLHSPTAAEDKCLHYVVSDGDVYIAGYRGEQWYDLARDLNHVQLIYDGTVIKTSTAAEGDFCINTRANYNGKQITSGTHRLELKAILNNPTRSVSAVNEALRIDDTAPRGELVEAEVDVHGTVRFEGTAEDDHAGVAGWAFEVQQLGQSNWRQACVGSYVPDTGRWACSWNSADGSYPDGDYRIRARMTDRATDGGNTGTSQVWEPVAVTNTQGWDETNYDAVTEQTDGFEAGLPDTFSEPGFDPNEAPDNTQPEPDTDSEISYACAPNDPFVAEMTDVIGLAPGEELRGEATAELEVAAFLALPYVPHVPVDVLTPYRQGADYRTYVARENNAIVASITVERLDNGTWVTEGVSGCSLYLDRFMVAEPDTPETGVAPADDAKGTVQSHTAGIP